MTGQDECGKSRPPVEFDPRTVQSVASRYGKSGTGFPQSTSVVPCQQHYINALYLYSIHLASPSYNRN